MRQRLVRRARKDLQSRRELGSGNAYAVDGNADGGALHFKASAADPHVSSNRGTLLQTSMPNQGWEQAWIEIVDTIGPLFPGVPEV